MKPATFHPEAAAGRAEAATRYEGILAGLGEDFRAELQAALARIQDNPLMYAAESGAIRIAPLHRFPFALMYEDLADRIWIAAVAQATGRPAGRVDCTANRNCRQAIFALAFTLG